jgi:hypothetical protein
MRPLGKRVGEDRMSKAIVGSLADPRTLRLLDEIRALRARVAELEAALQDAERAAQDRLVVSIDDPDPESELDPAASPSI